MNRFGWFAVLVVAIALGTWLVGWWAVPVVAGVWGWIRREDAAGPLTAGFAGMVAWGVLLGVVSLGAPGSVRDAVGMAMRVGPGALLGLTLAFPALLAASAAGVMRVFGGRRAV